MGRLMAIDYGRKRCGIAVTDSLRIVATALTTIRTCDLEAFVTKYIAEEPVDIIVVGNPTTMAGSPSESMTYISPGINRLKRLLPENIKVVFFDERFTSTLAHRAMIDGGMRQSRRRDKAAVDQMAATIILNDFLQSKQYNDIK